MCVPKAWILSIVSTVAAAQNGCGDDSESPPETSSDAMQSSSASATSSSDSSHSGDSSGDTSTQSDASDSSTSDSATWWQPAVAQRWHIQYSGEIDFSLDVDIYNLDLFETSAEQIATLHQAGQKVMCYLSAGSREDWRPDANDYPTAVIGKELDGWPGENWLDIRQIDALAPILQARLELAKSKGCDGVDPDNINAYTNDTGFPLTGSDQIAFNRWLAQAAHQRGLAIGLKNDIEQVAELLADFDWQLNEQCFAFDECDLLLPFIAAKKPVFHIEYQDESDPTKVCPYSTEHRFSTLFKNLELDAWMQTCTTL